MKNFDQSLNCNKSGVMFIGKVSHGEHYFADNVEGIPVVKMWKYLGIKL